MTLKELISRYVQKTEKVFPEIKVIQGSIVIEEEKVGIIIENARRYLEDARVGICNI